MKNNWLLALVLVLVLAVAGIAYAQMASKGMMHQKGDMEAAKMRGHHMMKMHDMCEMQGCEMHGLKGRASMAALDGHIFVLHGNKLVKYDRDLKLVKEVAIAADWGKKDASCGMEAAEMQGCPMTGETKDAAKE